MSSDENPPFIKWGYYKSNDPNKPDVLVVKVLGTETFATEYSTNVKAQVREGKQWKDVVLPLKSNSSNNAILLEQWDKLTKQGKLKPDMQIRIKTHLGRTKTTDRTIRKFAIEA